jgi:hypothetical protein
VFAAQQSRSTALEFCDGRSLAWLSLDTSLAAIDLLGRQY